MIMIRHELRQNRVSFWAWTLSIGFLIAVCIVIFPEMKGQMDGIGEIFASLGSFSEAFGMDKISFGTFLGFYSVECGNILGIGGAFFAALCGISALAKEEKQHTAEFLFTHPVGRTRVITQKLLAILIQILAMNLLVFALAVGAVALTGALRGAGDNLFVALTAALCVGAVRPALTLLAVRGLRLNLAGVWALSMAEFALRFFLLYPRFVRGKWKKNGNK